MKVSWSSRLRAKILSADSAILLSEMETLALSGSEYASIIDCIETGNSIYNLPSLGLYENACVLRTVDSLIQQKLIEPVQAEAAGQKKLPSTYYLPDFQKSYTVQQTQTSNVHLIVLTEVTGFDWHASWLTKINSDQGLTLVIVDDYLDPRLGQINAAHHQSKRPWLLLKVTGEQLMAGPFFCPEIAQAPCWQCLSERMYRNQPARLWLSRLDNNSYFALPIKIDIDLVSLVLPLLEGTVKEMIKKSDTGKLIKLDITSSLFEAHAVSKRPQCACCGNGDLLRQQIETPIALQASKPLSSVDGGYRTVRPETTLQRLHAHISPVTGVVASLQALAPHVYSGNYSVPSIQIFQSAFFKSPYRLASLAVDPFVQYCLGKGIDTHQSRASALCEAFERYAAQYQGDEPCLQAVPADLKYPAILPQRLAAFSETQYREFAQLPPDELEAQHGVLRYADDIPIPWTQAWSLTHQQFRYLPTTYCFATTPFDEAHFCRWGSNGCAAGNSLEEAILQGFFELVERDAVAIWWYNQIARPQADLTILPVAHGQRLHETLDSDWHYWVLDITHDLGIPVMVAVGQHKQTGKFSLGFGCHLEVQIAIERALTELCQLIPIRDQSHKRFNFDDIQSEPYLYPELGSPKDFGIKINTRPKQDIKEVLDHCLRQAATCGLEVIVLNYSRPDIPLFTVNVIVPGLCHIWPQMGCERLYTVPARMGWRSRPLHEFEMNSLKLFI